MCAWVCVRVLEGEREKEHPYVCSNKCIRTLVRLKRGFRRWMTTQVRKNEIIYSVTLTLIPWNMFFLLLAWCSISKNEQKKDCERKIQPLSEMCPNKTEWLRISMFRTWSGKDSLILKRLKVELFLTKRKTSGE